MTPQSEGVDDQIFSLRERQQRPGLGVSGFGSHYYSSKNEFNALYKISYVLSFSPDKKNGSVKGKDNEEIVRTVRHKRRPK